MANAITNVNLNQPTEFVVPVQATGTGGIAAGAGYGYTTLADQTTTTTATADSTGDMRVACKSFKALVYVKTYVVGTATVGPLIELQAASDAGFTTSVTTVDSKQLANIASSTQVYSVLLHGMTPLIAGLQYVRIKVTLSGNATIAFDLIIEGA